jgi:predicted neutral ceramidase superfamily lipid hydrolase
MEAIISPEMYESSQRIAKRHNTKNNIKTGSCLQVRFCTVTYIKSIQQLLAGVFIFSIKYYQQILLTNISQLLLSSILIIGISMILPKDQKFNMAEIYLTSCKKINVLQGTFLQWYGTLIGY